MAVIVIIQAYPYDAVAGGDGAYIQSLGQHLIDIGHAVCGLVSDTIRSRTNPVYQSAYPIERYREWTARGAVRLGPRTFLTIRRAWVSAALARLKASGGIRATGTEIANEEWIFNDARWVSSKLKDLRPDVAILCFGAIYFAPSLRRLGVPLFALPGSPMFGRELRLENENEVKIDRSHDQTALSEHHLRITEALRQADRVGFASYDDRNYAERCLGISKGMVVGMGFPRRAVSVDGNEPIVLFVGNMTHSNDEALAWFLSQVWPNIRAGYPSARFRVVGRAAAAIRSGDAPGVELIGPVQDLWPEYARAQVVIAPLLSGTTGVKVKVAEAMAYGRPLVTTSVGIDVGNRDQLEPGAIIANNAKDFATAIMTLLREPGLRIEKCRGAKEVFERWFSQEGCYREIAEWIDVIAKPAVQDRHG